MSAKLSEFTSYYWYCDACDEHADYDNERAAKDDMEEHNKEFHSE